MQIVVGIRIGTASLLNEIACYALPVPVREQNGNISQWFPRFDFARREGWLNRSIPCLGMLFGKSELNPTGWTKPELRATMQELKDKYPEMPGIGFCECSWSDFVLLCSPDAEQPLLLIHD